MIRKGDVTLDSLEAWERLAGPRSSNQWKDLRSAKECARVWLASTDPFAIPGELLEVIEGHPDFGEVLEWQAEPECHVAFDGYRGPANVDVLISARDAHGGLTVVVEAKADETFGRPVSRAMSAALERRLRNPNSKGLDRIEQLVAGVLGSRSKGAPPLHRMRYQLLSATAAALSRAKQDGSSRAVLMIHEFDTPDTDRAKRAQNHRELLRFLTRLGVDEPRGITNGELLGPIQVPGSGRFEEAPPLYVGKATRRVGHD